MENILQMPSLKPKIRVKKFGNQGWEVLIPSFAGMKSGRFVYANGERALYCACCVATIRTETVYGKAVVK